MFFACAVPELFSPSCVLLASGPPDACIVLFDFVDDFGFDSDVVP